MLIDKQIIESHGTTQTIPSQWGPPNFGRQPISTQKANISPVLLTNHIPTPKSKCLLLGPWLEEAAGTGGPLETDLAKRPPSSVIDLAYGQAHAKYI